MPAFIPLIERFMAKIHFDLTTGCWLWKGSINPHSGYGYIMVKYPDGRFMPDTAHRVAYRLFRGDIPEGLTLDHQCRVRRCTNPFHVEPATHKENILRGTGASARNAIKTHCPKGHPYSKENTYVCRVGRNWRRVCKICKRTQDRNYRNKTKVGYKVRQH